MDVAKKVSILSSWLREIDGNLVAFAKSLDNQGKQLKGCLESKANKSVQEYRGYLGHLYEINEMHRLQASSFASEIGRLIALLDD